ncbi:MAG: hypothetical protein CFH06_00736 [Alphaproteobacteria bacterium MarineAlpha3_Bin5]|nr:hypothetical protein [Magnetovibrio sp.]PPR78589.1 MAG: hypothetical protein CFH06_00736 [Alphaproteobacteria bacterium MarineAlpha3_Bin5]
MTAPQNMELRTKQAVQGVVGLVRLIIQADRIVEFNIKTVLRTAKVRMLVGKSAVVSELNVSKDIIKLKCNSPLLSQYFHLMSSVITKICVEIENNSVLGNSVLGTLKKPGLKYKDSACRVHKKIAFLL